jgi:hypothetical protein
MTIKKVTLARQAIGTCRYIAPPKAQARTEAKKD